MKKATIALCLLLVASGSVDAQQQGPRDGVGPSTRQIGGGDSGQLDGPRHGPPPEAYKACEGKNEGSTAQFTGPRGEAVTGTCRVADGRLVLRPDRPPPNGRGERRGPPPEAYKACEGKTAGSRSQLVSPRGETVKGTCEKTDQGMVLRPDHREERAGRER